MKKTTKGLAAGAVAVCLLAGMAGSPKKAESLEISVPFDRTEYDINTEIPVTISVFPEGSDLDNPEYSSDSGDVSFADSIIKTGETEGEYSFYVRSGDIESNVLSIHVVDITAQNEAAQKAEEERQTKEAAEKAAREAEEKAAAEQSAKEAEKKAAEEQAAREAEEKVAAEQTAKKAEEQAALEPVVASPEPDPAPAPQSAEAPVQVVETQAQVVTNDATAYLSATGSKYHRIDNCGKMNPNKARKTTVSEAEAAGYERCSKCW